MWENCSTFVPYLFQNLGDSFVLGYNIIPGVFDHVTYYSLDFHTGLTLCI